MLLVSTLAQAEFAATVGVRLRERRLDLSAAERVLADMKAWVSRDAALIRIEPEDVEQATVWLSRLDLTLRAADAMHIAAAARLGTTLLTFDTGMALAAEAVGVRVEAA